MPLHREQRTGDAGLSTDPMRPMPKLQPTPVARMIEGYAPPVDALSTLCVPIRNAPTTNVAIARKPNVPFSIPSTSIASAAQP